MIKLSVIIPTYNERENILILIERLQESLAKIDHEIIVVDDDSPDHTWELVAELSESNDRIRLIRRRSEKGLSSAVVEGFGSAMGEYLAVIDADLQHDETILPQLVQKLDEGNDLALGSRKAEGGGIENWSYFRRFVSFSAGLMAKVMLGNNVSDPMSGYFALTKKFFLEVDEKINPRGFKILLELLSRSKGKKIAEVGYVFRNRVHGQSKLNTAVVFDYLIALATLSIGRFIPVRFFKFGLIGFSGIVVNESMVWAMINWVSLDEKSALLAGIETSIITNFILNNYWTFYEYRHRGIKKFLMGLISYNFISSIGVVITFSIAVFLMNNFGVNVYASNLAGILVATVWNYRINFQITWKREF